MKLDPYPFQPCLHNTLMLPYTNSNLFNINFQFHILKSLYFITGLDLFQSFSLSPPPLFSFAYLLFYITFLFFSVFFFLFPNRSTFSYRFFFLFLSASSSSCFLFFDFNTLFLRKCISFLRSSFLSA